MPLPDSPQCLLPQTVAAAEPSVTLPASATLSGKLSSQQAGVQALGHDTAVTAGSLLTRKQSRRKEAHFEIHRSKEDSRQFS
jgi:hypothetical protein